MEHSVGYWIGYVGATAAITASLLLAVFYIGRSIVRGVRRLWK